MPKMRYGVEKMPEYKIWRQMRMRCQLPSHRQFKHYGGRGIKVDKKWDSFDEFFKDMGTRPKNMSIDRINNNGNYEPSNCRWATGKEQGQNRRCCRMITFMGKTQALSAWSYELGIKAHTIAARLNSGWTVEQALVPSKARSVSRNSKSKIWLTYRGQKKPLEDWVDSTKIPTMMLRKRLSRGWTVEQALTLPPHTRIK